MAFAEWAAPYRRLHNTSTQRENDEIEGGAPHSPRRFARRARLLCVEEAYREVHGQASCPPGAKRLTRRMPEVGFVGMRVVDERFPHED